MTSGRPAAAVDTNVFGAQLTRRGATLAAAYRAHLEGRDLFISFVTLAELRYGARLAKWGAPRMQQLDSTLNAAEVVWAGDGLTDVYASLRHDCTASGHPLGLKHHEADRWIAAAARWLAVPLITTMRSSTPWRVDHHRTDVSEDRQGRRRFGRRRR